MTLRAILTDIEGTTSSIDFVKNVLFPYAAAELGNLVRQHRSREDVGRALDEVAHQAGLPREDEEGLIQQLLQWMAEDSKITPLKTLQGMVWEAGYHRGDYRAHLYEDAATRLRQWHRDGLELYVYSSGSVQAQRLFFGHSQAGDLTPLFGGWFDTTIGPKRRADSYRAIVQALGRSADELLFLSDCIEELDAAREAGLLTCWLQRPADLPDPAPRTDHPRARDFHQVDDLVARLRGGRPPHPSGAQ